MRDPDASSVKLAPLETSFKGPEDIVAVMTSVTKLILTVSNAVAPVRVVTDTRTVYECPKVSKYPGRISFLGSGLISEDVSVVAVVPS